MRGSASSTTAEIYMQAQERTAISTALHPPKVWERFAVYSILKRTHLENIFHHINNLYHNIKFTMGEESMEIMERSLYWYIGSLRTLTIPTLQLLSPSKMQGKCCFLHSLFNRAYFIITNKDDLRKENGRIKQVLKENGYRKVLLVKPLTELLKITTCLSHNNKRKSQISKRKRSE